MCARIYSRCSIATCHDFARVLYACIRARKRLFLAWYLQRNEREFISRRRKRERERRELGLMRSENLLSGSQYYNYFINDSLIIFLFTDEQRWSQLFFFFPLISFCALSPTLLLFRVMTAPTIKVFALLENVSLEFGWRKPAFINAFD